MHYLAIQNTYEEVQIAVMSGTKKVVATSLDKKEASKELVLSLDRLLQKAHISLDSLSFIVANQGPGPFTTLRVVITTVNSIAYATHIPLIGINALYAAAAEWHDPTYTTTAILFNAFGQDVYALVIQQNTELLYGVYSITALLEQLKTYDTPIRFLGNGVTLHQDLIHNYLPDKAIIPEHIPAYCSLKQIAHMGWNHWQKEKTGTEKLLPLYLKQHPATL